MSISTNRANALKSTGPKTPEGKKHSSLNALRHGLTGQIVVLPGEDLQAYRDFCAQYHKDLKPSGILERQFAQTMADTQWRLNRIRAMESNLFSLGFEEYSENINAADPQIHCALTQAKAMRDSMDDLARLSLYEQRLNRTLHVTLKTLEDLQAKRKEAEQQAFEEAAEIRNLKEELAEPWQPAESGFEFSSSELAAWMARGQLHQAARNFAWNGELPASAMKPAA